MVLMASAEGIGEGTTDALMKAMGGKGKFAIVSCGETAENLNSWIEAIKSYIAGEVPERAKSSTPSMPVRTRPRRRRWRTDLMNAHPDLTGLVGVCSSSAPGVAQAVENAGKIGKVFTVGMGTPKT